MTAFLVMQAFFRVPQRKLIQRLLKGTSWAGTLQKSTGLHNGISGDLFQKSSLGLDSPRSTGAMPRLVTTWATKNRLLAHVLGWKRNKHITKYSYGSFPYFLQSYNALRMVGKSNSLTLIPGLQMPGCTEMRKLLVLDSFSGSIFFFISLISWFQQKPVAINFEV